MLNYLKISLFQGISIWRKLLLKKLKFSKAIDIPEVDFIESIDHFPSKREKSKRALITISANAWLTALAKYPTISHFNYTGLTYVIVKSLNQAGYVVDLCEMGYTKEIPYYYDLMIAHGGECAKHIVSRSEHTLIVNYISGSNRGQFERESRDRYVDFQRRKGVKLDGDFTRSHGDIGDRFEYVCKNSDHFFSIKCPRMAASYEHYGGKFHYTGLGSYLDPVFSAAKNGRNFVSSRKNFICVSATGGNIQKGLDIIIDAFSRNPDLHLYIYCKVEQELLRHCRKELNSPNIHYIYHHSFAPQLFHLEETIRNIAFTITAPINTGIGTAFSASLGAGLIPVGYVDYSGDAAGAVLSENWDVGSISECIRRASEKSSDWCERAAVMAVNYWKQNCDPENFAHKFSQMIEEVTKKN